MMRRPVSNDFIAAMEEKLEWGRSQGRTGWDSKWKKISVDSFSMMDLLEKLNEEVAEFRNEVFYGRGNDELDFSAIRHEAADVANVAMMIADMAGALDDVSTPEPPPVEGDTITVG